MTRAGQTMATRQLSGFRQVLGHFASGVTIVTGITEDGPAGFTCQSFSSLSLDPPLVLVSPSRSSTSWPRIAATGRFCVNILADHRGRISSRFAKPGGDKFADVARTPSGLGLPILKGSCAWIECHVEAVHPGASVPYPSRDAPAPGHEPRCVRLHPRSSG